MEELNDLSLSSVGNPSDSEEDVESTGGDEPLGMQQQQSKHQEKHTYDSNLPPKPEFVGNRQINSPTPVEEVSEISRLRHQLNEKNLQIIETRVEKDKALQKMNATLQNQLVELATTKSELRRLKRARPLMNPDGGKASKPKGSRRNGSTSEDSYTKRSIVSSLSSFSDTHTPNFTSS